MREIEFRAKTKTNKWVFGNYYICDRQPAIQMNFLRYFINPETLGQYTGLCDKNGTKIFEGDIIKYFEDNSRFEIKFNRIGYDSGVGLTGFVCVDDKRYCKEVDYDTKEEFYICDRCVDLKQVEVIGNIHDDPELLEE